MSKWSGQISRVLTENTEVLISSMTQKKNVREKTCQILREVLFCYEREEGMFIMDPIPLKIVEKTWKKMSTMSWQEITELTNLMRKQQPFVLAYLLAAGHEIFNQDEREQLLYLGVVIWQIMSQGSKPLTKITGDTLDGVEKANIEMLEYLQD